MQQTLPIEHSLSFDVTAHLKTLDTQLFALCEEHAVHVVDHQHVILDVHRLALPPTDDEAQALLCQRVDKVRELAQQRGADYLHVKLISAQGVTFSDQGYLYQVGRYDLQRHAWECHSINPYGTTAYFDGETIARLHG